MPDHQVETDRGESVAPILDLDAPTPTRERPRASIAAIAAAGLIGATVGYFAAPTSSPADVATPVVTATTMQTSPTTTTPPEARSSSLERPLRELVPGWTGTLSVVSRSQEPWTDITSWPAQAAATTSLTTSWAVPDRSGRLFATLEPAALGHYAMTLAVGRGSNVKPAVLDVDGFAWHDTEPGRIAWIQIDDDAANIRTGTVNLGGYLVTDDTQISVAPAVRMEAWGEWGFAIGSADPASPPFTRLLDASGNEVRHLEHTYVVASSPTGLVVQSAYPEPNFGMARIVRHNPASRHSDETEIEPQISTAAWSPSGMHLAVVTTPTSPVLGGELLVFDVDGTLLKRIPAPLDVSAVGWSAQDRFVVFAPLGSQTLEFYDIQQDQLHSVPFDTAPQLIFGT